MDNSLRVTLVQTSLYWESPQQNRLHFDSLLENVGQSDLIILPELFTTAFSVSAPAESMDGPSVNWLKQKAAQLKAIIIGSLIIKENNQKFNRLVCASPNGNHTYYDKRHLFSLMNEQKFFTSGKSRLIIDVKGWKICPLICYDLRFPVFSRNQDDFDLLIYIANWPISRISHWQKLLPARAIENLSYVVGVNRIGKDSNHVKFNGSSCVLDYKGDCVIDLEEKNICSTVTLNMSKLLDYRKKLSFLKDRDQFSIS